MRNAYTVYTYQMPPLSLLVASLCRFVQKFEAEICVYFHPWNHPLDLVLLRLLSLLEAKKNTNYLISKFKWSVCNRIEFYRKETNQANWRRRRSRTRTQQYFIIFVIILIFNEKKKTSHSDLCTEFFLNICSNSMLY